MASWGRLRPLTAHLQSITLDKDEISFGRARDCDVSMPNMPNYSGRHAIVTRRAGVVLLRNLSTNGTYLKQGGGGENRAVKLKQNEERELQVGDRFSLLLPPNAAKKKFGEQAVAFELEAAAPAASTAPSGGASAGGSAAPDATQFRVPAPRARVAQQTLDQAYEVSSDVLGAGQFAKVFLCKSRKDGKTFACKNIQKKKFMYQPKFEQNIKKEISILQQIKHPNIVQVVDVFDTEEELNLIMELMTGGELFDYIIDCGRLQEEVSRGIVEQVLQAVKHLHKHNILHRDLKPENILLESKPPKSSSGPSQELVVKLADFGIATIIGDQKGAQTYCGTPHYFAPEVHRRSHQASRRIIGGGGGSGGAGYGKASDMWSIGVIVFVMLSGRPPFCEENLEDAVLDQEWSLAGPEWNVVTEQAKDFVKQLMMFNPRDRLSAECALAHPWITGAAPEPLSAAAATLARKNTGNELEAGLDDEAFARHHSAPSTLDLLPDMIGDDDDDDTSVTAAASAAPAVGATSRSTADAEPTGGAAAQPRHHSDPVHSSSASALGGKRNREESTSNGPDAERPSKRAMPALVTQGESVGRAGGTTLSQHQEDSQSDSLSLSQSMIDDEVGWIWLWRAGGSWKRYDPQVNRSVEDAYQDYVSTPSPATSMFVLPGGQHHLHFEPVEAKIGTELPEGCIGLRQTRQDDIRKKRWVKRVAQDDFRQEHDKETQKNMERPREERKKYGYLY